MRSKRQTSPIFRTFRWEIGTIYASAAFGICDFIHISPVPRNAPKSAQFLPDIWGKQVPKTQERSISIISDSAHFVNHSSGNPQNIPVRATQCLHSAVFPRTCFLRANKKTAGTDLHKCPLPPLCDLFRSYFRSRCRTCTESFRFFSSLPNALPCPARLPNTHTVLSCESLFKPYCRFILSMHQESKSAFQNCPHTSKKFPHRPKRFDADCAPSTRIYIEYHLAQFSHSAQ